MSANATADLFRRQGVEKSIIFIEGVLSNTYKNDVTVQNAKDPSNALLMEGYELTGVNINQYHAALAYFSRNSSSKLAAQTMASAVVAISKMLNRSIASVMYDVGATGDSGTELSEVLHEIINIMRPKSSKQSIRKKHDNKKNKRARNVMQ